MVGSLTLNKINRNLLIHLNRFLESLPLFLKECYKKLLTILSTPGNIENAGGGGSVPRLYPPIVHFTVLCLVAKPLNRSEAKGDLVMIQTLLLFKCKLLCYHANEILVSVTTRSPSASLQIKGLATKCTTVKWPIVGVAWLAIIFSDAQLKSIGAWNMKCWASISFGRLRFFHFSCSWHNKQNVVFLWQPSLTFLKHLSYSYSCLLFGF